MTQDSQDIPETPPPENGRRSVAVRPTTLVAAVVACAVIGVWLYMFVRIGLGALGDPETLQNTEALIAILVIVGAPANAIIIEIMKKWLSGGD